MSSEPSAASEPPPAGQDIGPSEDAELWNNPLFLPTSAILLTVLMLVAVSFQMLWGGLENDQLSYRMGSGSGQAEAAGQWERLFLAGWLHASSDHWIATFGAALLLSLALHRAIGTSGVLLVYMLGSAAGFALEGWWSPQVIGLGGSGGAFALAGAGVAVGLAGKRLVSEAPPNPRLSPGELRGVIALLAGGFLAWEALFLWDPKASLLGHAGGVLCGLVLGLAICLPIKTQTRRVLQELVASLLLIVLPLSAWQLWYETEPWNVADPGPLTALGFEGLDREVDIDAPRWLIEHSEQWQDGNSLRMTAGWGRPDPLTISVIASAESEPAPIDPAAFSVISGERWRNPPREVRVQGAAFWFLDGVHEKDERIEFPRWIGHLQGMRFDVRFSVARHASDAWRSLPAVMMESIAVR